MNFDVFLCCVKVVFLLTLEGFVCVCVVPPWMLCQGRSLGPQLAEPVSLCPGTWGGVQGRHRPPTVTVSRSAPTSPRPYVEQKAYEGRWAPSGLTVPLAPESPQATGHTRASSLPQTGPLPPRWWLPMRCLSALPVTGSWWTPGRDPGSQRPLAGPSIY